MPNESVVFRRGPSSSMPSAKSPGTVLIQTDTGDMFVDDTDSNRVQVTDTRLSTRIDSVVSQYGAVSNGVLLLDLDANSHKITNLGTPSALTDAVNKQYVDEINTSLTSEITDIKDNFLKRTGGTMTGAISMGGSKITATYTPSDNSDLTNKEYVDTAIDTAITASDAMIFKGTIGTGGSVTQLPTSKYKTGWTYRVITDGTYAGNACEVGDMLIALNDGPSSGSSVIDNDWVSVQGNIDGAVIAPNNLTSNQLVIGNNGTDTVKTLSAGTNGHILKMVSGTPTWSEEVTYSTMVGATDSSNGSEGLVPAPQINNRTMYLRGDGTWAAPPAGVSSLLDLGVTATATELNYVSGVTSNIQTQLSDKMDKFGTVSEKTVTVTNGTVIDSGDLSIGISDSSLIQISKGNYSQVYIGVSLGSEVVIGGDSTSKLIVNALPVCGDDVMSNVPEGNQLITKSYVDSVIGMTVPNPPGAGYVLVSTGTNTVEWTRNFPYDVVIDDNSSGSST